MTNVTDEFKTADKRKAFLETHIVFVANVAELSDSNKIGVRNFWFDEGPEAGVATLKERRFGNNPSNVIKGYWLPWKTLDKVSMDLNDEADFFFTSQMTGCRFSVLTKDGVPPKVAHIAGTLSQPKREQATNDLVKAMGGSGQVRARSLSVSQSSEHGYSGQTADPGSAFVYGVRDPETKTWSFGAQIVGAKMLPQVELGKLSLDMLKTAYAF